MNLKVLGFLSNRIRYLTALICVTAISVDLACAQAAQAPTTQQPTEIAPEQAPKIPPDQLDSLVAPIALYPDPLLSQTLVASTYPLEIVQLQQWLTKNSQLKDKALVDAVSKESWDPSIQAMAALPDVVKRLADDIQWTTDLGNSFLAQQSDVMDAVQRMRKKAQDTGTLKSNEQQKVETQVVENKTIVVVEQADPQVVYVPSYNPQYVYGPAVYPYPGIYYPPYTAGAVVAAGAISFGIGVAMGAAWGGGWGWGAGWGHNDVDINVNNNFNRNANINGGNRTNIGAGGGNTWRHNPEHRGGAPYGDRQTANKFGGAARGDSLSNRQSGARQQIGQQGGNLRSNSAGINDRSAAGNRAGSSGISNRPAGGSRDFSSGSGNRASGFGGGSGGFSGSSARSSSSRGSSSMGSRGGGGGGGARPSRGGGGGRRR